MRDATFYASSAPRAPQADGRRGAPRLLAAVDGRARPGHHRGRARAARGPAPRGAPRRGARGAPVPASWTTSTGSRPQRPDRPSSSSRRRCRSAPSSASSAVESSRGSWRRTPQTFVAIARRMALGGGKGLGSAGMRARVALVTELPIALGVADGPLALALASRRDLAREWIAVPSTGSLPSRRLAARLIERAAHEAARKAAYGDDHSLRVFQSEAIASAWGRLLADRESLVWRHVAVARGLLAPWVPALGRAMEDALLPSLTPTEWRRAAASIAAHAAVAPDAALALARRAVSQGILKRDPGAAAAFVWGLPRAAEAEQEAAEELLDRIMAHAHADVGEAVVELRSELGSSPLTERAATMASTLLAGRGKGAGDDGAEALAQEVARDLQQAERDDQPLRDQIERALQAFASEGAKEAYAQARDLLAAAQGSLFALEAVAPEDDGAEGRAGFDRPAHVARRAARSRREPARARRARVAAAARAEAATLRAPPTRRSIPCATGWRSGSSPARPRRCRGRPSRARRTPCSRCGACARSCTSSTATWATTGTTPRAPAGSGAARCASRGRSSSASSAIRPLPSGAPSSPRWPARWTPSSAWARATSSTRSSSSRDAWPTPRSSPRRPRRRWPPIWSTSSGASPRSPTPSTGTPPGPCRRSTSSRATSPQTLPAASRPCARRSSASPARSGCSPRPPRCATSPRRWAPSPRR